MTKKKQNLVGRETAADVKPRGKSFRERTLAEAEKQGVATSESPNKSMTADEQMEALREVQGTLPGVEPDLPQMVVVDGKMVCTMNRPTYGKDDGGKFVELEFSFPLEQAHRPHLPKQVIKSWGFIDTKNADFVGKMRLSDQTINVYFVSDQVRPSLHLSCVPISSAALGIVQKRGEGTTEKAMRFIFRAKCQVIDEICKFADSNYGQKVWIEMDDTQGQLPEE